MSEMLPDDLPGQSDALNDAIDQTELSGAFKLVLVRIRQATRLDLADLVDNCLGEAGQLEPAYSNLWLRLRHAEVQTVYPLAIQRLKELTAINEACGEAQEGIFGRIRSNVQLDLSDRDKVARDIDVTGQLNELAVAGQLGNPTKLEQATQAISLLVATSLYKLYERGQTESLTATTALLESYTRLLPQFNPYEAGYEYARLSLMRAAATLHAHHLINPNDANDQTDTHMLTQVLSNLDRFDVVFAHLELRGKKPDVR